MNSKDIAGNFATKRFFIKAFLLLCPVFFLTQVSSIHGADPEIKTAWTFPIQAQSGDQAGNAQSQKKTSRIDYKPAVDEADGFVFLADRKTLYKLKIEDGSIVDKLRLGSPLSAPPLFHESKIYIADKSNNLICIGTEINEKPVWTTTLPAGDIISMQMNERGIICSFKDGTVSLSNRLNGDVIWKIKIGEGLDFAAALDSAGPEAYIIGSKGGLYLIHLNSGTAAFITSIPSSPISPPVCFEGEIYTSLKNGKFIALIGKTGVMDWEVSVINDIVASAVFYEDMICFNALNNQLFCHDKDSGTLDMRFSGKNRFYLPPVVADDLIFSFAFNNGILAANLSKGKTIGWIKFDSKPSAPVVPVPSKKMLLLINNGDRLMALDFNSIYISQHIEE
jgi:outer membrane protein assembly factor BamB